jgi:hypothetical protein
LQHNSFYAPSVFSGMAFEDLLATFQSYVSDVQGVTTKSAPKLSLEIGCRDQAWARRVSEEPIHCRLALPVEAALRLIFEHEPDSLSFRLNRDLLQVAPRHDARPDQVTDPETREVHRVANVLHRAAHSRLSVANSSGIANDRFAPEADTVICLTARRQTRT